MSVTLKTYFNTIRFLKPVQIWGQVRRKLVCPKFPRSAGFAKLSAKAKLGKMLLPAPGEQVNQASNILNGHLSFINQGRAIGWPPQWDSTECSRLWLYNLHYFEWIWALDYPDAKKAVQSWMDHHPPQANMVGWESYPLSLRLQNWVLYFYVRFHQEMAQDPDFSEKLGSSILSQGNFLRKNTERHLLGNHYFDNGVTLALLGSVFKEKEPGRWLRKGKRILRKQIPEQILPDGTHFERSPMYHSRIAYLLLMLSIYGEDGVRSTSRKILPRVLSSLQMLTHPDGGIALLNDSAFGIYNTSAELIGAAAKIGIEPDTRPNGAWSLPEAGYYGWQDEEGTYLVCDAGDIAPDYIPGHAHGDIFSYELSLGGKRIIVDTGLYEYPPGRMRSLCRSTRAHNTVEISETDQAQFWDSFRVARRGHPRDISYIASQEGFRLEGWHDGYCRLEGKPRHHRRFIFRSQPFFLEICDRVRSTKPVPIASYIHLHPRTTIKPLDNNTCLVTREDIGIEIEFFGEGKLEIVDRFYCPRFKLSVPNKCLIIRKTGEFLSFGYRVRSIVSKASDGQ